MKGITLSQEQELKQELPHEIEDLLSKNPKEKLFWTAVILDPGSESGTSFGLKTQNVKPIL